MSDDIDFSNAGLAERTEGYEPPSEEETPVADEPPEPVAEEVETAPEAVEAPVEEVPVEASGEDDSYRSRYENLVSKLGEQGAELGGLRAQLEELRNRPEPVQETPEFQPSSSGHQQILDAAAEPATAIDAYNYAAQHQPELIPDVLAEVRFHDPALAERMQLDYVQHMVSLQTAQANQYVQSTTEEQQSQQAVSQYASTVDGWENIREEVASIISEEPWLVGDGSPQAVQQGLRAATRMAQQARDIAATHARAKATAEGVQQRQSAAVETGTAGAAPVVETASAADDIRAAIFADDKRHRELF